MKKLFFIIAALFVTMVASAQLQLIKSFDFAVVPSGANVNSYIFGDWNFPVQYVYSATEVENENKYVLNFYDANTFDFYKTVTIDCKYFPSLKAASRNFWSTDGKLMFILEDFDKCDVLYDENGNIVQTFAGGTYIFKNLNGYILYDISSEKDKDKVDIYAIPGDIDPTTSIANVPSKKSRAPKSMNKGIVQINTENHLYTVNGQTLK